MNKTAIKNFAIKARKKLREDIKTRAGFIGITEDGILQPLPASTNEIIYFQVGNSEPISMSGKKLRARNTIVSRLEEKAKESDYKTAYNFMIENYASDWFNRLVAMRFMEVNEYFQDNLRMLSSSEAGRHDPDVVSTPFDSDLEFSDKERNQIVEWKQKNENDKLFRFLFFKRCNQLSKVLPGLFEEEGDVSELMFYQSFIDKDGIIYGLVNEIDEEDWRDQVQIIGWIYQYYNTELKDETFALLKDGKKISKERVPSATQLFTPDWIVRYMVENSLGKIWIEGHPNDDLKKEWKYYLDEAEQEPEVYKELKAIKDEYKKLLPEDLTFIDPCMGSGHILSYAFDVLMQIYESQGYTAREAAQSILKYNLYGLDIDDRAYQLAYFSIVMKARQYDQRILERGITPNVYSIQESNNINRNHLQYFGNTLTDIEKNNANNQIKGLLDTFLDAKEYGSILSVDKYDWDLLERFVNYDESKIEINFDTVGMEQTQKELALVIKIGKVLEKKYWITSTNPPYMGGNGMNRKLSDFVKKNYADSKADLFAVFIEKCGMMLHDFGMQSMITQHAWMFLSSFDSLRKKIKNRSITSMAHLGARAFEEIGGEVVQTTSFIMRNRKVKNYIGTYSRLIRYNSQESKEKAYLNKEDVYYSKQESFECIPGEPIAYWTSKQILEAFLSAKSLSELSAPKVGLQSGNNDKYYKLWYEVEYEKISLSGDKSYKWYPCIKGGEAKKWYGNHTSIINWDNDGKSIKMEKSSVVRNPEYYFKEGLTWTKITSTFAVRYFPQNMMLSDSSVYVFPKDIKYILGCLNSKVAPLVVSILNPTLNFVASTIGAIPIIEQENIRQKVEGLVEENISIARKDWDSYEVSWDFKEHPLVSLRRLLWDETSVSAAMQHYYGNQPEVSSPVELCWMLFQGECNTRFNNLKNNEEELNRIFIDIYGLQKELKPDVFDSEISIRKADLSDDIKSLISYAVGCMLGRYSLSDEGLAYAGGEWKDYKYRDYTPDGDNVIPVTDSRYMEDDIVEQFCKWLSVVYGDDYLEKNLDFIANALGTRGTDSRDVIRNYFLKDFFKEHCKTYSTTGSGKRPIYWLFDSGKENAFKALIYMHRYNADTIGRVRVGYVHPLQEKYENEVKAIETMISHMTDQRQITVEEKRKEKLLKQIAEIKEYDEKLEHLAQEKIEIDLDDGVKVNYEKIQTDRDGIKCQILAPIK